jgi:hypothetical protein
MKESCGRLMPGPQKDSPNPWFGCKNRVKRNLIAAPYGCTLVEADQGVATGCAALSASMGTNGKAGIP